MSNGWRIAIQVVAIGRYQECPPIILTILANFNFASTPRIIENYIIQTECNGYLYRTVILEDSEYKEAKLCCNMC